MSEKSVSGVRPRVRGPQKSNPARGPPDLYYKSHVLNSTGRYVRYIKKLRAFEEEEQIGLKNVQKNKDDCNSLAFFNHCDRRALINQVKNRVELSLLSYEEDLKERRKRLTQLLAEDEQKDVIVFVKQGQEGAELLWKDKMDRLAYLLEKRQKEIDDKLTEPPLEKCTHILPCLVALRRKECQEIQLYQMREKQMMKEKEREMDKMWYDLAMRESEILAARMEYDTIDRLRRDKEMNEFTKYQIEVARQKRAEEQEMLKKEALLLKADTEAYFRELEEEKRNNVEVFKAMRQEKLDMVKEREELLNQKNEQIKLMEDTYSATQYGMSDEKDNKERRKRIGKDLEECNFKLVEMKNRIAAMADSGDQLVEQLAQEIRDAADLKRCQYKKMSHNLTLANSKFNKEKAEEHERERLEEKKKNDEQIEFDRQVREQLDALVKHKELTETQARKLHLSDLMQQMEYTKVLKERAKQEAEEERKKCMIATQEYHDEIAKMLCRPFYSKQVHPFLKKMSFGMTPAAGPCICSKSGVDKLPNNTYCKDPIHAQPPRKY